MKLLIIFFAFFLLAIPCLNDFKNKSRSIAQADEDQNEFSDSAADVHHVMTAKCLDPFNYDEILEYLNSVQHHPSMKQSYQQLTDQDNFPADSQCNDVLCAIKHIFGEEEGPMMLYLHHRFNLNTSHLVSHIASKPNVDELTQFINGVHDLPPHLFLAFRNQTFIRFKRGYINTNFPTQAATAHFDSVEFYDRWARQHPVFKRITVVHELAHIIGMARYWPGSGIDNTTEWVELSDWQRVEGNTWKRPESNQLFVSNYAMIRPEEDFAESVVAYRYRPHFFKSRSIQKYNYIKNYFFAGKEYLDHHNCDATPSLIELAEDLDNDQLDPRLFNIADKHLILYQQYHSRFE